MSNPSINRWGVNSIWYNFWYTDSSYGRIVSQDRIFSQLINTYVQYGLSTSHSYFSNKYWFSRSQPELRAYYNTYFWRYTAHKVQIGKKNHLMRYKRDDVFNMRTWVLRYGGWLILNLYWFRPHKKKFTVKSLDWCFDRDHLTVLNENRSTKLRRLLTLTNHKVLMRSQYFRYYQF